MNRNEYIEQQVDAYIDWMCNPANSADTPAKTVKFIARTKARFFEIYDKGHADGYDLASDEQEEQMDNLNSEE